LVKKNGIKNGQVYDLTIGLGSASVLDSINYSLRLLIVHLIINQKLMRYPYIGFFCSSAKSKSIEKKAKSSRLGTT